MLNIFKGFVTALMLAIVAGGCAVSGTCVDSSGYCLADNQCWLDAAQTLTVPGDQKYDSSCATFTEDYSALSIYYGATNNTQIYDLQIDDPASFVFFQNGSAEAVTVNNGFFNLGVTPFDQPSVTQGLTTNNDSQVLAISGTIWNPSRVGVDNAITVKNDSVVRFQNGSVLLQAIGNMSVEDNGALVLGGGVINSGYSNTIRVGYTGVAGNQAELQIVGSYNPASLDSTCDGVFVDDEVPADPNSTGAYGSIGANAGACTIQGAFYGGNVNYKLNIDVGPYGLVQFTKATKLPILQHPASIQFEDTNPTAQIGNADGSDKITLAKAIVEEYGVGSIANYELNWGDGTGCKIATNPLINQVTVDGSETYEIDMIEKPLPAGAQELYAYSKTTSIVLGSGVDCVDGTRLPINTAQGITGFLDAAGSPGKLNGKIQVTKAFDESNFTHYRGYVGVNPCEKAVLIGDVAKEFVDPAEPINPAVVYFALNDVVAVASGDINYVSIYPVNLGVEMACVAVAITDAP